MNTQHIEQQILNLLTTNNILDNDVLLSVNNIKQVNVNNGNNITININLNYVVHNLVNKIKIFLQARLPQYTFEITVNTYIKSHIGANSNLTIPNVKNVIAIGSGKGGVGKSSITCNLAVAMAKLGAKVGVLDADVYGPSVAKIFATEDILADINDNQHLQPIVVDGIATLSITNLVGHSAAVWRGPMASRALQQMLFQTNWPKLDYLFIDLPPGTGDIQLTLAQKVPVTTAIIVATMHELALIDAKKAKEMFDKVGVPTSGVIFNMTHFNCDNCGHQHEIFKHHQSNIELSVLGNLPISYDFSNIKLLEDNNSLMLNKLFEISSKISYEISKMPQQFSLAVTLTT